MHKRTRKVTALFLSAIVAFSFIRLASAAEEHTVTFNNNGRGVLKKTSVTVEDGKTLRSVLQSSECRMDHVGAFQHQGWGTVSDAGLLYNDPFKFSFDTPVTSDLELYAIWTKYINSVSLSLPDASLPAAGKSIPSKPEVVIDSPVPNSGINKLYDIVYTDTSWNGTKWLDQNGEVVSGEFKDNQKYILRVSIQNNYLTQSSARPFYEDSYGNIIISPDNISINGQKAIKAGGNGQLEAYFEFTTGTVPAHSITYSVEGPGQLRITDQFDREIASGDQVFEGDKLEVKDYLLSSAGSGYYCEGVEVIKGDASWDDDGYLIVGSEDIELKAVFKKSVELDSITFTLTQPECGTSAESNPPLFTTDRTGFDQNGEWVDMEKDAPFTGTFGAGKYTARLDLFQDQNIYKISQDISINVVGGELIYKHVSPYGISINVEVTAKHSLSKIDRVEPTHTSEGTEEYYKCDKCGHLFSDPEGTIEIDAPVTIPMLEGDPTPVVTAVPSATAVPEPTDTVVPTVTDAPEATQTVTPVPSATATVTPAVVATATVTVTSTPAPTATATVTATAVTVTPVPSATAAPVVKSGKVKTVGSALYVITGKNTVEFKGTTKDKAAVSIPATVKIEGKKYKVTSIAAGALKNKKKLKSAVIGKNVSSIGSKAFYNCKKLEKVTFKTTKLRKVGKYAFKGIKKNAKLILLKKNYKLVKKAIAASKPSKVIYKKK